MILSDSQHLALDRYMQHNKDDVTRIRRTEEEYVKSISALEKQLKHLQKFGADGESVTTLIAGVQRFLGEIGTDEFDGDDIDTDGRDETFAYLELLNDKVYIHVMLTVLFDGSE